MTHPEILEVERVGYVGSEPREVGVDYYGNEVYEGDEVYRYDGEMFLVQEVSTDALEILELVGAELETV